MGLSDADWDELFHSIQQKECTPFIGAGAGGGLLPLGKDIANKWAKEYGFPFKDTHDLKTVSQFLAIDNGDELFPKRAMTKELQSIPIDIVRDKVHTFLADLDLPVYITTNYDYLMESALKYRAKEPASNYCKWNDYQEKAITPDLYKSNEHIPSATHPLVYHLHGVINEPGSLLLTDDDYLNFLSSISTRGAETLLPPIIRDVLASSMLLFIGYSLEDINFRLILRLLSGLNASRGIAVMLPPEIFPEQRERASSYIEKYMKQMFSVNVFLGTFQDFAKEFKDHILLTRHSHYKSNTLENVQTAATKEVKHHTSLDVTAESTDPYIGLRPFSRGMIDQRRFFGREHETQEIITRIITTPLTVVYGKTGVGKTSIFNAQIIPSLENRGIEVLPNAIVGSGAIGLTNNEDLAATKNLYILNTFRSLMPTLSPEFLLNKSLSDFLELYFPLRKDEGIKTQVLIFDKFEEFFKTQFYQEDRKKSQLDFFIQIDNVLRTNRSLRFVIVIREEFVNELDDFKDSIPSITRARYKLTPLTKDSALLAVRGPLKNVPSDSKPQVDVMEQEIKSLVNELVKMQVETYDGRQITVEGEFVDPLFLQLICFMRWKKINSYDNKENNQETESRIEVSIDEALIGLYEDAIHAATNKTRISEKDARKWSEEKLITAAGTRRIVFQGQTSTEGLPNEVVEILDRMYLVRRQFRSGGIWYELAHDRLIGAIRNSNFKWKDKNPSLLRSIFKK